MPRLVFFRGKFVGGKLLEADYILVGQLLPSLEGFFVPLINQRLCEAQHFGDRIGGIGEFSSLLAERGGDFGALGRGGLRRKRTVGAAFDGARRQRAIPN